MNRSRVRTSLTALLAAVVLSGTSSSTLAREASRDDAAGQPVHPFGVLDGGQALLPHIQVTTMTFEPGGAIYAGGRRMVAAPTSIPPIAPTGSSVWLVSHDHGAHWLQRSVWPTDFSAQNIVVDPTNPHVIYAAGCVGGDPDCQGGTGQHMVLRTRDGGQTWQDALYFSRPVFGRPTAHNVATNIVKNEALLSVLQRYRVGTAAAVKLTIVMRPRKRLYACVSGLGMLRSDDDARSWLYVPQAPRPGSQCELAVDPRRSGTIYSMSGGTLYRTTDGGNYWIARSKIAGDSLMLLKDSLYVTKNAGLYRSSDGGVHWKLALQEPALPHASLGGSIRGDGGWITAIAGPVSVKGIYVARDGGFWQAVAFTAARGPKYYGALDADAMSSLYVRRMWEDHAAHIVFTVGQVGGLFRWSSWL